MKSLVRAGRGPVPAGVAALAAVEEGVEIDELAGERVLVGGHGAGEHGQPRIAVADLEIAQHLIVGAVLLDDVDHVADVAARRKAKVAASLAGVLGVRQ